MYFWALLIILVVAIAILIAYIGLKLPLLQFIGGFEWSSLETVQPLGSGAFGDVYVVKDSSNYYALKREKIPTDWVDTNGNELKFVPTQMGELEFYKFIDTLPKDLQKHFVRLHNYRIFKCDHVHKLADWQIKMMENNQEFRSNMNLRINSPYCAEYLMDIGGNSLEVLIESGEIKPSSNEMRSVVAQLLKVVKIVGDNGYIINDLHSGNVVVNDGICKLIDYGEVKKLPDNSSKYKFDLTGLLSMISGTNSMFRNLPPASDPALSSIINHIKFLRENNAWDDIYKYIRVMNPNSPDLNLLLGKPELLEDEIKIINNNTGPYLAMINLILYPDLNAKYWRRIYPDHTLQYTQYVDEESLMFFLDNFNDIDALIDYFNNINIITFSVDSTEMNLLPVM